MQQQAEKGRQNAPLQAAALMESPYCSPLGGGSNFVLRKSNATMTIHSHLGANCNSPVKIRQRCIMISVVFTTDSDLAGISWTPHLLLLRSAGVGGSLPKVWRLERGSRSEQEVDHNSGVIDRRP